MRELALRKRRHYEERLVVIASEADVKLLDQSGLVLCFDVACDSVQGSLQKHIGTLALASVLQQALCV